MEPTIPFLVAGMVGFSHAFEADHLVAVSNIVTRRQKVWEAAKDGLFWGLGHTSTIFIIGVLMILMGVTVKESQFSLMEAFVGLVLIALGIFRLAGAHKRPEYHTHDAEGKYHLAYGVGLVHGLAGSGAIVLLVMTEIQGSLNGLLYLLIFGLGSVLGMLLAAGLFSLPFSRKVTNSRLLQRTLIYASSLLCIGYGIFILVENLR